MKKLILLVMVLALTGIWVPFSSVYAQEEAGRTPVEEAVAGDVVSAEAEDVVSAEAEVEAPSVTEEVSWSGGFLSVVIGSGAVGVLLWLVLFGAASAGVYFAVDCAITVRAKKIIPQELVDNVTETMAEGDVLKALQNCENEPGPMANILTAGFSHVEEGFDVIQEVVGTAADLETEKIMQKLTWLSVVGNLAPMLGLLGTVQGMIAAFSTLGVGAPDVGVLAMNISQALFTTAAGLTIAVPCVAFYYIFRNTANRIILRMEAMTMELIKDLRNVEVVEE